MHLFKMAGKGARGRLRLPPLPTETRCRATRCRAPLRALEHTRASYQPHVPPPSTTGRTWPRGNYRHAQQKGMVKTQEKHKSSACRVSSPSRQLGFNSSPGERMGRARGGRSHRTVNGRRTGSPRTRLGLIEHHQRSAPN